MPDTSTTSAASSPVAEAPSHQRLSWRVVDIVVASVIGVASGLVFGAWDLISTIPWNALTAVLPGLAGLVNGMWLFAAVLAGLIVRKPGVAIYAEVVAAFVETLVTGGTIWGVGPTLLVGLVQGIGAELVFLAFRYRVWNLGVAILAGAVAGVFSAAYSFIEALAALEPTSEVGLLFFVTSALSGAVIAGALMWFVYLGIAKTGALSRFASGRRNADLV